MLRRCLSIIILVTWEVERGPQQERVELCSIQASLWPHLFPPTCFASGPEASPCFPPRLWLDNLRGSSGQFQMLHCASRCKSNCPPLSDSTPRQHRAYQGTGLRVTQDVPPSPCLQGLPRRAMPLPRAWNLWCLCMGSEIWEVNGVREEGLLSLEA